jgi:hypothetical protein
MVPCHTSNTATMQKNVHLSILQPTPSLTCPLREEQQAACDKKNQNSVIVNEALITRQPK